MEKNSLCEAGIAVVFRDAFHPGALCLSPVGKELGMFRWYLKKGKGCYDFLVRKAFGYNSCRAGSLSRGWWKSPSQPHCDFFTCPDCCYKLLTTAVLSLPLAACCTTSSPGICSNVPIKLGISVHLFGFFKAGSVIHDFWVAGTS